MKRVIKNWNACTFGMSAGDAGYLLGLLSADIGALRASGADADKQGNNDLLLKRAYRIRQKLNDSLEKAVFRKANANTKHRTGTDQAITLRDQV